MVEAQSWRNAESKEEFIDEVTRGTLQALEEDDELMSVFSGSKYDVGLPDHYNEKRAYGNPLTDFSFFSLEDKSVPEDSVECLQQADTLYEGVAMATKSGVQQLATKTEQPIEDLTPDSLFTYIVGIARVVASHVEIKHWMNETDAIFFNDPQYIDSIQ